MATRIQLCGRLLVRLGGRRVEDALPGSKGRLLLAYLVLHRSRRAGRDELLEAVWGEEATPAHHARLNVLLSKLRLAVGPGLVTGRSQVELALPPDAFVDVEAAAEAVHRADHHIALAEWAEAWGPAGVAYHIASRELMAGHDAHWLDGWRRRLEELCVRGLEGLATARLELGGPALAQAETCARRLVELAPFRESGHRILMEALERRGNAAEALLAYERLRTLLREELGAAPGAAVQSVHRRLLAGS